MLVHHSNIEIDSNDSLFLPSEDPWVKKAYFYLWKTIFSNGCQSAIIEDQFGCPSDNASIVVWRILENCYWPGLHNYDLIIQFTENRREVCHRFWLRLRHAMTLISNDRTSVSKKINGMALIWTLTVSTNAFERTKEKSYGFRQTE